MFTIFTQTRLLSDRHLRFAYSYTHTIALQAIMMMMMVIIKCIIIIRLLLLLRTACDVVGRDHVIYTARHPPCVRHNIINLRRFSSRDQSSLSLSLCLSHTRTHRQRRNGGGGGGGDGSPLSRAVVVYSFG